MSALRLRCGCLIREDDDHLLEPCGDIQSVDGQLRTLTQNAMKGREERRRLEMLDGELRRKLRNHVARYRHETQRYELKLSDGGGA